MADDPLIRETTCDPRARKVLVTDAKTKLGRAMVEALVAAGADLVWAGYAAPWKPSPHLEALGGLKPVTLVPLDVTDESSVRELAGSIGGKVDILINTAEYHRPGSFASRPGVETARTEMEVNYFGLLRLAQSFAPALKARAAPMAPRAPSPGSTSCRSMRSRTTPRTALSRPRRLPPCRLRRRCAPICRQAAFASSTPFPGRSMMNGTQLVPPPKLSPAALASSRRRRARGAARGCLSGRGRQGFLARFLDNPKALERELAG